MTYYFTSIVFRAALGLMDPCAILLANSIQYDLPGKCCAKSKQYWTGHFQNFLTFPFGLGLGRCTCFYLNGPKLIGCTRVCEKARLVSRNKKRFNTFGCHCKNPNRNPKLEKSCSKQADVKLRREKREHRKRFGKSTLNVANMS